MSDEEKAKTNGMYTITMEDIERINQQFRDHLVATNERIREMTPEKREYLGVKAGGKGMK